MSNFKYEICGPNYGFCTINKSNEPETCEEIKTPVNIKPGGTGGIYYFNGEHLPNHMVKL